MALREAPTDAGGRQGLPVRAKVVVITPNIGETEEVLGLV
jgi:hypothetical protein